MLTQPGIYLLAAQAGLSVRRVSPAPDGASLRITRGINRRGAYDPCLVYARDVLACQRIAEHTQGVHTFFALLHHALRLQAQSQTTFATCEVRWWETGRACTRHYRAQTSWHAIRPDGAAEVVIAGRHVVFWLEWDRSTMGLRDLRAKFTAYAEYVRSREWRTDGNVPLPLLLIVTTDTDGETRVAHALDDAMPARTPLDIRVATASAMDTSGPLGNIWRSWIPGTPMQRVSLGLPGRLIVRG